MALKYCPRDQRNVETEHSWNTIVLILLLLFFTLIGLIYLAIKWKRRCPICHLPDDQLLPPQTGPQQAMPGYVQGGAPAMAAPAAAPAAQNCPTCGQPMTWMAQYNRWYCTKEQQYK